MGFGFGDNENDEILDKKDKHSDRESSYPFVSCKVTSCTYNRHGSCRKVSTISINAEGVCEFASKSLADSDDKWHWENT
jgi:hypothetical protein